MRLNGSIQFRVTVIGHIVLRKQLSFTKVVPFQPRDFSQQSRPWFYPVLSVKAFLASHWELITLSLLHLLKEMSDQIARAVAGLVNNGYVADDTDGDWESA